jgi:hypothetical protein
MRCRLSPTADVPSHSSGAAMWQRTLPPDGDLGQRAQTVTIRKPVRAQSLCRQRDQSLPLVFRYKETTMTKVHVLQSNLEAARLKIVETLAAKEGPQP